METIQLSNAILKKLGELRRAGGYETISQGLEHAIDHHLVELRRQKAEKIGKKIKRKLKLTLSRSKGEQFDKFDRLVCQRV